MRRPGGYLICTSFNDGRVQEADTFSCAHCNRIVVVKPMSPPEDMGGRCGCCDKLICANCVERGVCDPLEEKLKRIEASHDARRSYGMI